jgi:hypothetical protein
MQLPRAENDQHDKQDQNQKGWLKQSFPGPATFFRAVFVPGIPHIRHGENPLLPLPAKTDQEDTKGNEQGDRNDLAGHGLTQRRGGSTRSGNVHDGGA